MHIKYRGALRGNNMCKGEPSHSHNTKGTCPIMDDYSSIFNNYTMHASMQSKFYIMHVATFGQI